VQKLSLQLAPLFVLVVGTFPTGDVLDIVFNPPDTVLEVVKLLFEPLVFLRTFGEIGSGPIEHFARVFQVPADRTEFLVLVLSFVPNLFTVEMTCAGLVPCSSTVVVLVHAGVLGRLFPSTLSGESAGEVDRRRSSGRVVVLEEVFDEIDRRVDVPHRGGNHLGRQRFGDVVAVQG